MKFRRRTRILLRPVDVTRIGKIYLDVKSTWWRRKTTVSSRLFVFSVSSNTINYAHIFSPKPVELRRHVRKTPLRPVITRQGNLDVKVPDEGARRFGHVSPYSLNTLGREHRTLMHACEASPAYVYIYYQSSHKWRFTGTDLVCRIRVYGGMSQSLERREREKRVSPAYALRRRKKKYKALKTVSCVISKENYSYIV